MIRQDQSRATVQDLQFGVKSQESILATNKVLKNTYMLLSLTMLFSAFTAYLSMISGFGLQYYWPLFIAAIASMFAVRALANSGWGLVMVFVFTGIMGATLGAILTMFLSLPNGNEIVMQALGGTGIIFFGLSGYALTTKKDFSYLGGFLSVGIMVAFLAAIANIFLGIGALALAISSVFILLSSGLILFETSRIINGGERNYINATVTLYVSIYNIFVSLLQILGVFNND